MNKVDKASIQRYETQRLKERAHNLTVLRARVGTLITEDEYKSICNLAMSDDDRFMGHIDDFSKHIDAIEKLYKDRLINDRQHSALREAAVDTLGALIFIHDLEYALRNIPTAHTLLKGGIYDKRGYERQVDALINGEDFILEWKVEKPILRMVEVMCENDYVASLVEITKKRQHIVMKHRCHPEKFITVVRRKWPIIGIVSTVAKDEKGKKMKTYHEVRKYLTSK